MTPVLEDLARGDAGERPDLARLAEAARELGYRLPHLKPEELRELRTEIAGAREKLESTGGSELSRGVLLALGQVALAYGTETERLVERQRTAARARAETLWAALVRELDIGPARPSELSRRLGRDPAQISRGLRVLEEEGLVHKLPVRGDRKAVLCCLTPEGTKTASAIRGERGQPMEDRKSVFAGSLTLVASASVIREVPSLRRERARTLHRAVAQSTGPTNTLRARQPLRETAVDAVRAGIGR